MGTRFSDMFPQLRGVVLQDGHVDPVTGPRCMVKMSEGPFMGRYIIAHTAEVLAGGTQVLVDDRRGRTMAHPLAAQVDRNPEGEDPQGLRAKPESAVPKACAQTQPHVAPHTTETLP